MGLECLFAAPKLSNYTPMNLLYIRFSLFLFTSYLLVVTPNHFVYLYLQSFISFVVLSSLGSLSHLDLVSQNFPPFLWFKTCKFFCNRNRQGICKEVCESLNIEKGGREGGCHMRVYIDPRHSKDINGREAERKTKRPRSSKIIIETKDLRSKETSVMVNFKWKEKGKWDRPVLHRSEERKSEAE